MKSELEHLIVFRRRTDLSEPMQNIAGCFGVNCECHGSCLHYAAIEHCDPHAFRMGHCPIKADGTRSLYVPIGGV
jgi:hypothetical protein